MKKVDELSFTQFPAVAYVSRTQIHRKWEN